MTGFPGTAGNPPIREGCESRKSGDIVYSDAH